MAKDPAFLFYTNDFLSGISDLTMEERGQFITLLCLQHQKGHLSEKAIRLSVGNAAADVMSKFRQDSGGLWYNERLELEVEKRKSHSNKQRERALKGWEKRKKKQSLNNETTADATALHLENVNEDVNSLTEVKGEYEGERGRVQNYLLSSFSWHPLVCRAIKSKQGIEISVEDVEKWLVVFCDELEAKDDLYKTDQKNKSHFVSWLAKELKAGKKLNVKPQEKLSRHDETLAHNAKVAQELGLGSESGGESAPE